TDMKDQFAVLLVLNFILRWTSAGHYSDMLTFFNDRLDKQNYNPQIRPLIDQSHVLEVTVLFELVSIVEVNEVTQSFNCNGFLFFNWTDEILAWNKTDNVDNGIHPLPADIWRPRVILMNTLEKRDLFDDDKAPVFVLRNGTVIWVPGSLFPTSCQLNMTNYPFDQQTCHIKLVAMSHDERELQFRALYPYARNETYTLNGEWDLLKTEVRTETFDASYVNLSSIQVLFVMKRRPTFFLLNILFPVVFLSFLNIFVFVIPAESGEKISYGITVLLAISVYMSTVSGMLPRASETLPYVIIYLFILLILSMITVICSIIIVQLHNMEEKEDMLQRVKENFGAAFSKVNLLRRAVTAFSNKEKLSAKNDSGVEDMSANHRPSQNKPKGHVAADEEQKVIQRPKINQYKGGDNPIHQRV
ncbi:neuronal acetylcholine receptor subunit beta-4, partial [Biomphalaria glabrata]